MADYRKNHIYRILTTLLLAGTTALTSCTSPKESVIKQEKEVEVTMECLAPYFLPGWNPGDEIPAMGVPSEKEALLDMAIMIANHPGSSPLSGDSHIRQCFDKEEITRLMIGQPVLIYSLAQNEEDYRENIFYIFPITHRFFGIQVELYYEYFTEIDSYTSSGLLYSCGRSQGSQYLTPDQVRRYAEAVLEIDIDKAPVAVHLPSREYFYQREDFAWFFTDETGKQYILYPFYQSPLIPLECETVDLVERLGTPDRKMSYIPSKISTVESNYQLYDLISNIESGIPEDLKVTILPLD